MNAALEQARSDGAATIWLGVWERNLRAIAFYRKSGFADVGAHDFLFGAEGSEGSRHGSEPAVSACHPLGGVANPPPQTLVRCSPPASGPTTLRPNTLVTSVVPRRPLVFSMFSKVSHAPRRVVPISARINRFFEEISSATCAARLGPAKSDPAAGEIRPSGRRKTPRLTVDRPLSTGPNPPVETDFHIPDRTKIGSRPQDWLRCFSEIHSSSYALGELARVSLELSPQAA